MLTGIIWILAMIWAYIKPTDSDTHINSESIEELPE